MNKIAQIKEAAKVVDRLEDTISCIQELQRADKIKQLKVTTTTGPNFETTISIPSFFAGEIKRAMLDALNSYKGFLEIEIDKTEI